MKIKFIDTHAHLQEETFVNDIDEVIKRAINSNVIRTIIPNLYERDINRIVYLKQKYPEFLDIMIGIYPITVTSDYTRQVHVLEQYLSKHEFIGIGEIGLDYHLKDIDLDAQRKLFVQELNIAKELKLPVSIHSQDAADDMYKILKEQQNGNLTGVIHGFYDSVDDAKKLVDLGFYLGIGGFVTFNTSKVRKALKVVNPENIVLETDSPYLTPTPFRKQRNEPSLIRYIAQKVADVYQIDIEKLADICLKNSREVFNITNV